MQKAAIVRRVAEALGCRCPGGGAVDGDLATIKEALQQGKPVILRRFGTWHVRAERAHRCGRDPKTGATAAIPAGGWYALWPARR